MLTLPRENKILFSHLLKLRSCIKPEVILSRRNPKCYWSQNTDFISNFEKFSLLFQKFKKKCSKVLLPQEILDRYKDICIHQPLLLRAGFELGRAELGVNLFTKS